VHPILFTIGNFPIGTYGVLVALSALAALGLAKMLAPEAGLDPERMVDLFVYALLAAFVGAKVALIIGDFRAFSADPLGYLVENLRSFGAFYGGFIAAVLVAGLFLRKHRIPFWPAADVTAICLALAQSMGRWGCFFAGCCYGKPTDLPWGMVFPAVPLCADGTHIHPWPLYESAADLAIFGFLLWRFRRQKVPGQVFLLYAALYATARGLLEFLRGDVIRGLYFGGTVSLSQIVALGILVVSVGLMTWRWWRARGA
jgi:phosphatidylglycerol:prolipoprotein diacylglycerol transferase